MLDAQRTDRARTEHGSHTECPHRPQVRPLGDARRRDRVAVPVTGDEGDAPVARACRSRSERSVHRTACRSSHLLDVVEERVEARPAEDADLCFGHSGGFGVGGRGGRGRATTTDDDDPVASEDFDSEPVEVLSASRSSPPSERPRTCASSTRAAVGLVEAGTLQHDPRRREHLGELAAAVLVLRERRPRRRTGTPRRRLPHLAQR